MSGHHGRDELVAGRYLTGVAGAKREPSTQAAANAPQPCIQRAEMVSLIRACFLSDRSVTTLRRQ